MEINEEVTNTSKIIVTNKTIIVINNTDLISSRVEKFKCTILRSIGMKTLMSVLTQHLKLLNQNFTCQIRMITSRRELPNRILKVTTIILRLITIIFNKITIFSNEIGSIRLITRVLFNSKMENLIQSSTDINILGHLKDLYLKMTFNRTSSRINQISITIKITISLTLRRLSLEHHHN